MGFFEGGLVVLRTGLAVSTVGEGAQAQTPIKSGSCGQFSNGTPPF